MRSTAVCLQELMHGINPGLPLDFGSLDCFHQGFVENFNLSVGLGPEGFFFAMLRLQVFRKPFHA